MGSGLPIAVSVVILTKNEEAGIADTLSRVQGFDQVVVVDSNSTDKTVAIAKSLGAEVVNFTWDGRYPKKKQWSLENSGLRHRWVLLLDADEYPSEDLVEEIRDLMDAGHGMVVAYEMALSYRFAGRFLRHGHRVTKRSLLDLSHVVFPVVDDLEAPGIREVEGHYQPVADGAIGKAKNRLFHDDKDPISSWFERHNRYSDWEAYLRLNAEARRHIASKRTAKGRFFDKVPCKPIAFFLYSYLCRAGFLDGRAGFDYSVALSTYYWQIGVKVRELRSTARQ